VDGEHAADADDDGAAGGRDVVGESAQPDAPERPHIQL